MSRNRLTAWLPVCIKRGALLLASAGVLALSACGGGSGAPNNPYTPIPSTPGPLTVVPDEAIAFAGTPLVLSISGGTPPYQAFSANPAALPVPQNVNGNTLVLLANNVAAQEAANVTIRDSGGQSAVSEIVVRPAVLLPASITIVPNSAPCAGGDVCSGQTSVASLRVTGATGSPLAGRSVRFDVVQGQFALQTTNPGSPLAATQTVVSDANGEARVVISVPSNTPTQIGLLRATELSTGSQVTAQFIIAQVVSGDGVLSVVPSGQTTVEGPFVDTCSSGARVSHYIFGGTPPYRIVVNFPDAVTLVNGIVNTNGGGFDIITNGTCFVGLTFAITDANGRTLLSPPTVNNVEGTTPRPAPTPPTPPTALASNPANTTVTGCSGRTFQFTVTGGTPPYSAVVAISPQTSPVTTPVITQGAGGLFTISFPAGPPFVGTPGAAAQALFTVTDSQNPQRSASSTITCN